MWLFAPSNVRRKSAHTADSIWRPRRDLNPCYRRESGRKSQSQHFYRQRSASEHIATIRTNGFAVPKWSRTAGFLPGYPLRGSGKRTHWRFLLSEIKQSMLAKKPTKRVPGVLPHDRNRSTEARPTRTDYAAATDALRTLNGRKQTQEARKVNSVFSKDSKLHRNASQ
jgi:hypothetical protein